MERQREGAWQWKVIGGEERRRIPEWKLSEAFTDSHPVELPVINAAQIILIPPTPQTTDIVTYIYIFEMLLPYLWAPRQEAPSSCSSSAPTGSKKNVETNKGFGTIRKV